MSSNMKGSFLDFKHEKEVQQKSEEEKHLFKLLALVSEKLYERFKNLQTAFRFLDTDHSQSISLNEFSQAIDHLRLKLPFEDVKKLYRFIDKDGTGEIGYDEFTMLTEEKWRGIDPFEHMQ
jgi:Ca2+-binding EF-hand superfamily protein